MSGSLDTAIDELVELDPAALSDAELAEFLFVRANPKGPLLERWVHTHGCRRWFDVVRDTSTNVFE